ncbi:RNase H domain protein [Colletotrichum musicola]|uniref:ribonuclease H n=1 Tax=Colletotrichum musicola TaxID=2175873 RepID=A0A8H6KLF5_9PEZI|nr:RNase H domain protein [Colletotrichum musicola]
MLFMSLGNRYVSKENPFKILIFVDGACSSNGTQQAAGGCSFVCEKGHSAKFRLEDRGPDNKLYRPTSNRAELRATLAASDACPWYKDGFKSIVMATDSTYVAKGATEWSRAWIENGWRGRAGQVKNRDLWEALLHRIEEFHSRGLFVSFWWIPRKWNTVADRAAKQATEEDAIEWFGNIGQLPV